MEPLIPLIKVLMDTSQLNSLSSYCNISPNTNQISKGKFLLTINTDIDLEKFFNQYNSKTIEEIVRQSGIQMSTEQIKLVIERLQELLNALTQAYIAKV